MVRRKRSRPSFSACSSAMLRRQTETSPGHIGTSLTFIPGRMPRQHARVHKTRTRRRSQLTTTSPLFTYPEFESMLLLVGPSGDRHDGVPKLVGVLDSQVPQPSEPFVQTRSSLIASMCWYNTRYPCKGTEGIISEVRITGTTSTHALLSWWEGHVCFGNRNHNWLLQTIARVFFYEQLRECSLSLPHRQTS